MKLCWCYICGGSVPEGISEEGDHIVPAKFFGSWRNCMPDWEMDDFDYPGSPCMPEELRVEERPIFNCLVMCLTCGAKDRRQPWWMYPGRYQTAIMP